MTVPRVPSLDRLWALTRPGVLSHDLLAQWAGRVADRAVRRHALHCGVPEVEAWAKRWLSGEDRSAAAADAARATRANDADAAYDAAYAAGAAAWAASGASEAAYRAAARAAWAAGARAAARAAERRWQLALLRKMMREAGIAAHATEREQLHEVSRENPSELFIEALQRPDALQRLGAATSDFIRQRKQELDTRRLFNIPLHDVED